MKQRIVPLFVAVLALALGAPFASVGAAAAQKPETVVLAGGCFWGMQGVFEHVRGVTNTVVGYSGGSATTAHYDIVSTGDTGHAESLEITFDPSQITFTQLLDIFFTVAHDPTEVDRQGPDVGSQYRSVVFYATPQQRDETLAYIRKLTDDKTFRSRIVTQVVPLRAFYPAEAYHQHFMDHNPDNPYIVINDVPKVDALRARFPQLVKR